MPFRRHAFILNFDGEFGKAWRTENEREGGRDGDKEEVKPVASELHALHTYIDIHT